MKKIFLFSSAVLLLLGNCGSPESGFDAAVKAGRPVFDAVSAESVLLRNLYPAGRKDRYVLRTKTELNMDAAGRSMTIPMDMDMWFRMDMLGKGDGDNYDIELVITRMTIESRLAGISFDSARTGETNAFPGASALKKLLNSPIRMRANTLGKVISMDTDKVLGAIEGIDPNTLQILRDSIRNIQKSAWTAFPEHPVKKGDVFVSQSETSKVQGMFDMKMDFSYRVGEIAADKSKVILEPLLKIEFFSPPGGQFTIKTDAYSSTGWFLFNRTAGRIDSGKMAFSYSFRIKAGGQDVKARTAVLMDLRLE